jgi:succinate-semialdehyde dehydrogenase/glutarate-semialdehyde dehydrogenase
MVKAINPATSDQFASYEEMTGDVVGDAIGKTHNAFLTWRRTSFSGRASLMHRAARVLRDNADEYAKLMAQEMGKPISDGAAEIEKCALTCDFYADNAERFLASEPIKTEAHRSSVIFQPLGRGRL